VKEERISKIALYIDELKVDLTSKILTSSTGLHLVYKATPANSSTLYPNVEDYKRLIGLSSHMAYLKQIIGCKANER